MVHKIHIRFNTTQEYHAPVHFQYHEKVEVSDIVLTREGRKEFIKTNLTSMKVFDFGHNV